MKKTPQEMMQTAINLYTEDFMKSKAFDEHFKALMQRLVYYGYADVAHSISNKCVIDYLLEKEGYPPLITADAFSFLLSKKDD